LEANDQESDAIICGIGAATAVGLTAWASAAAVRAGISGFSNHPFMVDSEGLPMPVAACARRCREPDAAKRIENCLVPVLAEVLRVLRVNAQATHPLRPALLLALPAARIGLPDELAQRTCGTISRTFPKAFGSVSGISRGHAAGVLALASGLAALASGQLAAFVVAGADSYLDPDTLEWLEETQQYHGTGKRNNAWGFVPGEGAGAILVVHRKLVAARGLRGLARIDGIGIGQENKLIRSGQVCLGDGLSMAMRGAVAGLRPGHRITDVYCDMNGDPYRADEFAFAAIRSREHFVTPSEFVAPADCWGDVGAASVPLAAILAVIAPLKAYARGGTSLVWASSDTGERGAALLESLSAA
jgi:3-oxoacyl-[acyl-carrier-protein] synthase-1